MSTSMSLKARLHDCDMRILLNHARQEAIVFEKNGSRIAADTMVELKSQMNRLQIERAAVQEEVIILRNPSLVQTPMA